MNFIGYVRVSTEDQAKKGISLESQEEKIKGYASLNELTLSKVVRDEGESGKNLNRPGIKEIIDSIKNGWCHGVIVYKLDRLSRSVIDTLVLIEKFDKQNIAFHSITEHIDTKSAMGRFFITILSALAQMEREMISERTKGALNYKRSIGGLAGGVPYGYRSKGKKKLAVLIKDDQEQRVLKMILDAHVQKKSLNSIANDLNKQGIASRCNGKWYPQTVKSIIQHSTST